jgi:hypothetical protein
LQFVEIEGVLVAAAFGFGFGLEGLFLPGYLNAVPHPEEHPDDETPVYFRECPEVSQ